MFLVFLHLLAFPVLFGTAFGYLFGLGGVWIGLTVASVAALLVGALTVKFRYGNESFPLLLDVNRTAAELSYDVPKGSGSLFARSKRI